MTNRVLIERLASDDPSIRRAAARSLAEIPAMLGITDRDERDISDAIAPLAVALFDEDEEVRRHAAGALRGTRRDRQDISSAMPALLRALADPRADLRRAAILILRDAILDGQDAASYEGEIVPLLEDTVNEVKWAAADALAYYRASKEDWDGIRDLLHHADPDVAQETAGTLAKFYFRFHYQPVLPDLVMHLAAPSLELRLIAARAVARRSGEIDELESLFPILLEGIEHKDKNFRVAAARTLDETVANWFSLQPSFRRRKSLGSKQRVKLEPVTSVLAEIKGALADENDQVQAAVIRTFGHFILALPSSELPSLEDWLDLLVNLLDSDRFAAQKAAAGLLTRLWVRERRWAELEDLIRSESDRVQRQVLITLADKELIRTSQFKPLLPAILEIVTAPDSDLSYPASKVLGRFKSSDLLSILESGPLDSETSWDMLRDTRGRVHRDLLSPLKKELKAFRSPAAKVSFLTGQLTHQQAAVRAWAAEALWEIALKDEIVDALPSLVQVLDDPDTATRAAAALALGDASKRSGIDRAFSALLRLTEDESGRVRKNAFRALGMAAEAGGDIAPLIPALGETLSGSPHGESRSEAARLLASASIRGSSIQAQVPTLAAALDENYPTARFYAARALYYALEGGDEVQNAVAPLVKALLDPDERVADWALAALEAYATELPRAEHLFKLLRELDGCSRQLDKLIKTCESRIEESHGGGA